jgi:hypothetical protein
MLKTSLIPYIYVVPTFRSEISKREGAALNIESSGLLQYICRVIGAFWVPDDQDHNCIMPIIDLDMLKKHPRRQLLCVAHCATGRLISP